jgi:hypothetical protein
VVMFIGPAVGITGASIVSRFIWRDGSWWRAVGLTLVTVAIWLVGLVLLRCDPLRVGEWWMD